MDLCSVSQQHGKIRRGPLRCSEDVGPLNGFSEGLARCTKAQETRKPARSQSAGGGEGSPRKAGIEGVEPEAAGQTSDLSRDAGPSSWLKRHVPCGQHPFATYSRCPVSERLQGPAPTQHLLSSPFRKGGRGEAGVRSRCEGKRPGHRCDSKRGEDTHIVILRRVDLFYEPLHNLLLVEPLGVRRWASAHCPLPPPVLTPLPKPPHSR